MKTPSDNLHLLIKSLTKSEKRYFKLYARLHGGEQDTSYVTLFDAIEQQNIYNESKLKEKLRGTSLGKNLAVAKSYLYKLILKSLFLYGANNDVFEDLVQQFIYGKILYKKGLYSQAKAYLGKAKKKSIENEKFLLAADIEKWERIVGAWQADYFVKENIERNFGRITKMIKMEENILTQVKLNDLLFIKLRKAQQARKKEEITEMTEIIKPNFKSPNKLYASDSVYRMRHQSLALYYYYIGDYQKQYEEMREAFLWASKKNSPVGVYQNVLINYFGACHAVQKYDECELLIQKFETLDITGAFSEDYRLSVLFWLKQYIFIETGRLEEGNKFVKGVEKRIMAMDMKNYYYNLQGGAYAASYLFFIQGNYSESLKWLNKFFFFKKNDLGVRAEVYFKASLLYILVHYELKNEELLKYVIKQTYKWLLKINALNEYESTILNFIRKEMPIHKTTKQMIPAYEKLKNKLILLSKDPLNKPVFDLLDLTSWLESKIQKKSFEEIVRKKLQARQLIL